MEDKTAELVLRLQKGDKDAFEQLFEQYKTIAVRTAYLMTGSKALAEDIVQEAFITSYLRIDDLKEPAQFKAWFFKTLTRMAWKQSAKEKIVTPVENIFEIADDRDTQQMETTLIAKEESNEIMTAVNALEEKQKTVILLYYYSEFSVAEIAKIMNCFEGTVKSRLYAARKNLQKTLCLKKNKVKEGMTDAFTYRI